MDPMIAAESGWRRTRRKNGTTEVDGEQGQALLKDARRGNAGTGTSSTGGMSRIPLGIGALVVLGIFLLVLLVTKVGLEALVEEGTKMLKSRKGGCSACPRLDVLGGEQFVSFDPSLDQNGCSKLAVQCGLEKGTEAIIQWYKDDQNMGVSFMHEVGQSNVRRTVECNAEGQFELEENGHRGVVTAIECIVAGTHEEL